MAAWLQQVRSVGGTPGVWRPARPGTGQAMIPAMPTSPPPGPTTAPAAKRRGRAAIWLGAVLIAVGIVGGIGLVVAGARSVVTGVDELERVPIEGGTVEIDGAKTVTVYAERDVRSSAPTTYESSSSGGPVPEVDVTMVDGAGVEVPVRFVPGSEQYQSDGHWGTRIGKFDAPAAGTYTVRIDGGPDVERYDSVAVGGIEATGLVLIVVGILGGGFVVLVGLVLLIVGLVRRSRSKRPPPVSGAFPPGAGWAVPPGPPPPTGPTAF